MAVDGATMAPPKYVLEVPLILRFPDALGSSNMTTPELSVQSGELLVGAMMFMEELPLIATPG
jgi:hypothetical protein